MHDGITFSGLPYQKINDLIGIRLIADKIHFSEMAKVHVVERHPLDLCYLHCLGNIIREPDYIGMSAKHPDNFYIVTLIEGRAVLAAVNTVADTFGAYPLMSFYSIDSDTMQGRIRKGFLKKFI